MTDLGQPPPGALVEARLELHWAAQIVGAAAGSRISAKDDFSHTNLGWHEELGGLVTHLIDGRLAVGLRFADITLVIVDGGGAVVAEKPLAGVTLEAGMAWLTAELDTRVGDVVPLVRLAHDMPEHAVGSGGVFGEATDAHVVLGRWFALAHAQVTGVAKRHGDAATAARCWPHHFDLATLVTVEAHADPEEAKTVGVGMSPGDGGYREPYFYVTPWPRPEGELPNLEVGNWHTEGWTGAVLTGTAAIAGTGAGKTEDVSATLASFVEPAVAASLIILTGDD